ncbi:MAG TPA: hypothetical protein PKD24_14495 [Pyrinomonadaceae bacterium]|nr:hypothetical protein [Pyrinomonadaceae bacterium]HMP66583.1 hypothetical protein [Pyrinomonadaceae bacterium]
MFFAKPALGEQPHHMHFEYMDTEPYTRQQEGIGYNGDGRILKIETSDQEGEEGEPTVFPAYRLRSSILGGEVVYENGQAFVYAGGEKIATNYEVGTPSPTLATMWHHKDPNMSSYRSTEPGGTVLGTGVDNHDWDKIETDGDGKSVGLSQPSYPAPPPNELYTSGWSFGTMQTGQYALYTVDGLHVPPETFAAQMGRLGSSADIDCTREEILTPADDGGRIVSPCYDTMTLALHGIFVLPYSGPLGDSRWPDDRVIYRDYAFATQPQPESENMRNFRDAVQAARDILNENGGDNPCARFFEGAGLEALAEVESVVSRQGENTFEDLQNGALGIRMGIPTLSISGFIGYGGGSVTDLDGNVTSIPGRVGYLTPNSVRINTRGPFVRRIPMSNSLNDRLGRPGGYAPGSLQSRVVQLLHEAAHLLFRNRRTYQVPTANIPFNSETVFDRVIPLDGEDHDPYGDVSGRNTNRVMAACRAQINRIR